MVDDGGGEGGCGWWSRMKNVDEENDDSDGNDDCNDD